MSRPTRRYGELELVKKNREKNGEKKMLISFAAAKHGSEVKNPNITSFTKTLQHISHMDVHLYLETFCLSGVLL